MPTKKRESVSKDSNFLEKNIIMKIRYLTAFLFILSLFISSNTLVFAQSRPQRPDEKTINGKKNNRPTLEEIKKAEEEEKIRKEEENAIIDNEVLEIKTNIVNVDAVVVEKKTGNIITGLKRGNFGVFENGVKQDITNFAEPEAPITVTLLVEYSKWSEVLGQRRGAYGNESKLEVVRPVAYFLSKFIKAPDDYASVIAFDIRPTPITDFTNDPERLRATVDILLRNSPAFRENNLFDSLKFALVGGKGDAVVLEDSKEKSAQYGGMVDIKSPRKAIILVASGIDTFSRTNYDEIRKIIQEAGVPIYVVSTGNYFFKLYGDQLPPTDSISGAPGRLTFLQAQNIMNTFAKESGGRHFPMTFEGELPGILQSINALMRNQYSIGYEPSNERKAGEKYKIEVKVDVNGDGIYDDKQYEIQHRPYYKLPKEDKKSKK